MIKVLFFFALVGTSFVSADDEFSEPEEERNARLAEELDELVKDLDNEETTRQDPYLVRYAVIPPQDEKNPPRFGPNDAVPTVLYHFNEQSAPPSTITYHPRPPSLQSDGKAPKQEDTSEEPVRYVLIRPNDYHPPPDGSPVFAIHQPNDEGGEGDRPQVFRIRFAEPPEGSLRYPQSSHIPSDHQAPPSPPPNYRPRPRPPPPDFKPPPVSDYQSLLQSPPPDYQPHLPPSYPKHKLAPPMSPPYGTTDHNSVGYDISDPDTKIFTLGDTRPDGPPHEAQHPPPSPHHRQVPLSSPIGPPPPLPHRPITRIIIRRPAPPPPPKVIPGSYKSGEDDEDQGYHPIQYSPPPPRHTYPTPKYHPSPPPTRPQRPIHHVDDDEEDIDDISDHRKTHPSQYTYHPSARPAQYLIPTKHSQPSEQNPPPYIHRPAPPRAVVPLRSASDEQHYPRHPIPPPRPNYESPPPPSVHQYDLPPAPSYRPPASSGPPKYAPQPEKEPTQYRPAASPPEYGYKHRDQGEESQHHTNEDEGGDVSAIPGDPDKDYPVMSKLPSTIKFSCHNKLPGYYADVEHRCQVYYLCSQMGRVQSFLCPNGTVFNQLSFVCEWWYNVDCGSSEKHFGRNSELYKVPLPPKEEYDRDEPQYIARPQSHSKKQSTATRSRGPQIIIYKQPVEALPARDQDGYQQAHAPEEDYRHYQDVQQQNYRDYQQPTAGAHSGDYDTYRQPAAPATDDSYRNYHQGGTQIRYAPSEYNAYEAQAEEPIPETNRQKTKRVRKRQHKSSKQE